MRLIFLTLILSISLQGKSLPSKSLPGKSFFNHHAKGWHWYEQKPFIQQEKEPSRNDKKPLSATGKIAGYRRILEEQLSLALLEPTPTNIKAYITMQKDLMDRSKLFSETWLQTIFTNPSLDHTLISPVNQKARHVQIDQQKQQTFKLIKELSKEYGLFFFFKGSCEYCHQFAPIVKQFSKIYGWDVLAISEDGSKLEEFSNSVHDNGLMDQWNVEILPALFAIHPKSSKVIPIAYGLTSLEEMENRIIKLSGTKP